MQNTKSHTDRPALIYGLTRCVKFKNGCGQVFIPEDPYGIYAKLAVLFVSHKISTSVEIREVEVLEKPYDLLKAIAESNLDRTYIGLLFVKWLHQEIPDFTWKYNSYLGLHKDLLIESMGNQATELIWIDMKGVKNKIKQAYVSYDLFKQLRYGNLILPSYSEIQTQVSAWGKETKWKGNNPRNTSVQYNMPYHDLKEPTSSINVI